MLAASHDAPSSTTPATSTLADGQRRPVARLATLLLIGQLAARWGAFLVLRPAIDWPASRGEPAAVMLPVILDQAGAVLAGYLSYLLHALLLIPLAVLLRHTLLMGLVLGGAAVAFGVLAGFAKALGIAR